MKQDHIVLKNVSSDIPKPRLLDSRGKRSNNAKISIYSNKYMQIVSAHSLPEETTCSMVTTMKLRPEDDTDQMIGFQTSKFESSSKPKLICSEEGGHKKQDEKLFAAIKMEIEKARVKYEEKIRKIVEANTKIVHQLKELVIQQQWKLAEKEEIIQSLINKVRSTPKITFSIGDSPNKQICQRSSAHNNHCINKILDLQAKLRLVSNAISENSLEMYEKMDKFQRQLLKYNGHILYSFRHRLGQNISILNKKIDNYCFVTNNSSIKQTQTSYLLEIAKMKTFVLDVKKEITEIKQTQCKYVSPQLQKLQIMYEALHEKISVCSLAGSRRDGYLFDDEDEFFYPSSDRIYQTNDQYEHFQSDSEEQAEKKQNRSPNCKGHTPKRSHR